MRGVCKLLVSGARFRPEFWTYSEVENRKKGDVSLKALTKDILRASAPTVADNIACICFSKCWLMLLEACNAAKISALGKTFLRILTEEVRSAKNFMQLFNWNDDAGET